jgi:uncharacterized protein (DUF488 family)
MMSLEVYTIGHSTHPLDVLLALLAQHDIELVADIRRFPGSRKFAHFNRDSFAASLAEAGINYLWIEALGGRRRRTENQTSANLGLRNESFRNYADYMATEPFREGVRHLLDDAARKRTAFMCSESVFWRCHRRLVSDFLVAKVIAVLHIMPGGELRPHTINAGAAVADGEVAYPAQESRHGNLLFE